MARVIEQAADLGGLRCAIYAEVITYSNRSVDLLVWAIRGIEDPDELGRLRALVWEFHAGNALVFGDLMAEIEARAAVMAARREQVEIFGADAG